MPFPVYLPTQCSRKISHSIDFMKQNFPNVSITAAFSSLVISIASSPIPTKLIMPITLLFNMTCAFIPFSMLAFAPRSRHLFSHSFHVYTISLGWVTKIAGKRLNPSIRIVSVQASSRRPSPASKAHLGPPLPRLGIRQSRRRAWPLGRSLGRGPLSQGPIPTLAPPCTTSNPTKII